MAETLTTRAGLVKPDSSEPVDVADHIAGNLDRIDAVLGATVCTSGTRPTGSAAWSGRIIRETDTGKMYVYSGSAWLQVLVSNGSGFFADALVDVRRATSTDALYRGRVTGDTVDRFVVDAAGKVSWGPGSGVDTNLYRNAANELKTDDSLIVSGDLSVLGVGKRQFGRLTADRPGVADANLVDSGLSFVAVSGGVYTFDGVYLYVGDATGDIKFSWTFPAGTMHYGVMGANNAGLTGAASNGPGEYIARQNITSSPATTIPLAASTSVLMARMAGIFICTTGGTVTLRHAQSTTTPGVPVVLKAGSYLGAVREA